MTLREYYLNAKSEGKDWGLLKAITQESGLSRRTVDTAAAGHWVLYSTAWLILSALRRLDPDFSFVIEDADRMNRGEVIFRGSRKARQWGKK